MGAPTPTPRAGWELKLTPGTSGEQRCSVPFAPAGGHRRSPRGTDHERPPTLVELVNPKTFDARRVPRRIGPRRGAGWGRVPVIALRAAPAFFQESGYLTGILITRRHGGPGDPWDWGGEPAPEKGRKAPAPFGVVGPAPRTRSMNPAA